MDKKEINRCTQTTRGTMKRERDIKNDLQNDFYCLVLVLLALAYSAYVWIRGEL